VILFKKTPKGSSVYLLLWRPKPKSKTHLSRKLFNKNLVRALEGIVLDTLGAADEGDAHRESGSVRYHDASEERGRNDE